MAGRTDNRIVVDAPLDVVWELTNDVERWPDLFGEYKAVEVLERRGPTVRFRLVMHPDEDGKIWSWVSERTPDPSTRTVTARRIETGPFEYMNLRWEFRPVDGGVEMRWIQEFQMRPGAPVDDEQATAMLDERTAIEMRHVKDAVERVAVR